MKIGIDLIGFLPLYGKKIPRKYSFFLYNFQFNCHNFENKDSFSQNLAFSYSIGSTEKEYGKKKNLQNFLPV